MLLSNSQISMGPLCLNLLFTPVEFFDSKCLTKCQSWFGMVKPSPRVSFGLLVLSSCV